MAAKPPTAAGSAQGRRTPAPIQASRLRLLVEAEQARAEQEDQPHAAEQQEGDQARAPGAASRSVSGRRSRTSLRL